MSQTTRRGLTAVVGLAGFAGLIAVDELVRAHYATESGCTAQPITFTAVLACAPLFATQQVVA